MQVQTPAYSSRSPPASPCRCPRRVRTDRQGEVSVGTLLTVGTSQPGAEGRSLTGDAQGMTAAGTPSTASRKVGTAAGTRLPLFWSGRTAHRPPRRPSSLPSSLFTSPSFSPAPHHHHHSSPKEPGPRPTSPATHLPSYDTTHLPTRPFLHGAPAPAI